MYVKSKILFNLNKLSFYLIIYFVMLNVCSLEAKKSFKGRYEQSVEEMYDADDLGSCCLFAGNFINFGWWNSYSPDLVISLDERLESEKNLYRLVLNHLNIKSVDHILDVGCGKGCGCILALEEFGPQKIQGLDISQAQIKRAKNIYQNFISNNSNKIAFMQGAAEKMPYENEIFDKLLSVEAAQHFTNLQLFVSEAYRVLKPKGKLAVASFFGTLDHSSSLLADLIQTIHDGIDHANSIIMFKEILEKEGFKNIEIINLGQNVWPGYDKWVSQGDLSESWTRNWYVGYQKGLIDYYLITAEK